VSMQMSLDTPYRASRMAPIRALEALSSKVLQATLKACMGPYLERLVVDYEDWAECRPRRQAQIQPQPAAPLFLDAEASAVEGLPVEVTDASTQSSSAGASGEARPDGAGSGTSAKEKKPNP
jgi:hypothetical protein